MIVVRDAGPVLMQMRDRGIDHPRLQRAFRGSGFGALNHGQHHRPAMVYPANALNFTSGFGGIADMAGFAGSSTLSQMTQSSHRAR